MKDRTEAPILPIKMTETLEERSRMCVNHIRTMHMSYVLDCDLIHRNCTGLNFNCPNYKSVQVAQVPISRGCLAYTFQLVKQNGG